MSFGYSIGDVITVTQLAWKTVQNAREACGEYDELTREVLSLHIVLRRLEQEVEKPDSPINDVKSGDTYKEELGDVFDGCKRVLNILDQVLTKYNALSEPERSGRKLWQQIWFGNGKMTDLAGMRDKLTYYTSAMSLFLNMVSVGTMGRVERQMNTAGGDLREIQVAVNSITAHLMSKSTRHEGSILTAYADDDRAVWKEFRRELLEDGFSSSVIRKHKGLIKAYIEELGTRGLLDEEDAIDEAEESPYCDVESIDEGATAHDLKTHNESEAPTRPKAEVELPVRSKPLLNLNTGAALLSKSESGHKQGPTHDPISRDDSEPEKPRTELRCIWLSNESNGKNQKSLAEDIRASNPEHGFSFKATEQDRDRGNDAGEEFTQGELGPAGEDDETDDEAEEIPCSRPRRSSFAFTRDAMTPPPQPPFTKIFTKSDPQDEKSIRLFHDTWHETHENMASGCIIWMSLSIPPIDIKNSAWKLLLLGQLYLSELRLRKSKPPADLIVRQKELISDIRSMRQAIQRFLKLIECAEFPIRTLEDRRSKGTGYRVIFDNWANAVVVSTGAKCSLCRRW